MYYIVSLSFPTPPIGFHTFYTSTVLPFTFFHFFYPILPLVWFYRFMLECVDDWGTQHLSYLCALYLGAVEGTQKVLPHVDDWRVRPPFREMTRGEVLRI